MSPNSRDAMEIHVVSSRGGAIWPRSMAEGCRWFHLTDNVADSARREAIIGEGAQELDKLVSEFS